MFQPRSRRALSANLAAVSLALAVFTTGSTPARANEPARSPRRYIPADGLVAYFEYEGLEDHARAWQATAAHDLFTKTKAGSMLREVFRQTFDGGLDVVLECLATSEDITDLADVLLRSGVEVAVYGKMDEAVIVLRRFARPDNRSQLGKLRAFAQFAWIEIGGQSQAPRTIRGRTVFQTIENDDVKHPDFSNPFLRVQPRGKPGDVRFSTWREGDDWILVVDQVRGTEKQGAGQKPHPDLLNRVLDSIDGKCPNVTRHPGYVSAVADATDLKGFEPNGMYFAEVQPLVSRLFAESNVPEVARSFYRQMGLDGLVRIVGRWGFQGRATLTSLRLEMPAPRRGLLTAFNQPGFRTDHLPVIPPDARSFVLASLVTNEFTVQIRDATRKLDPSARVELALLRSGLGVDALAKQLEELVRHLGPEWALIDVPDAAEPAASRARPHPVLVATVDDPTAFDRLATPLAAAADRQLGQLEKSRKKRSDGGHQAASYGMKRLPAPDRGFRIDLPGITVSEGENAAPIAIIEGQAYSGYLVVGERSVALAFDLESARRVLMRHEPSGQPWKASGEAARVFEGLPPSLTLLSVSDPKRCGIPEWIVGVPASVRWLTIGAIAAQDKANGTAWFLLNLFGQPRPGQIWLRLAPQDVPTEAEIRSYFFPSVLAAAVDDRGYRILQREPLPFAGLASELAFHQGWKIDWSFRDWPKLRYQFNVTSPWIEAKH